MQRKYQKLELGKKTVCFISALIALARVSFRQRAIVLGAVLGALAVSPSFAGQRYDGLWSVSIVTTRGDCIASYRYPMRIANGILVNAGDIVIDVSGKVASSGAIKVTVSHGDTSATGSGRLSGASGQGFWSGASCSGSWTAERRSL